MCCCVALVHVTSFRLHVHAHAPQTHLDTFAVAHPSLTHLHLQELGDVEGEGAQHGRDDVLESARQRRGLDEGVAVVHGIADCHVPNWNEETFSDVHKGNGQ